MMVCKVFTGPLLLLSLVMAMQAGAAHAQQRPGVRTVVNPPEDCYVSDPVQTENVYSFLKDQILALSLAERGERANAGMLETRGGAPLDEMDKTIAGLRMERVENICASFVISPYVESKIPSLAAIAKPLAGGYDELGRMSNQMLGISLQKTLSRTNGTSPQLQLSRLMDKRREILRNMTDALNLTLSLLVDSGRMDSEGKPDHLVLRNAEIRDLLRYLYARFPTLKNGQEVGEPSGDFAKQAASIEAFFSSGYRPADLP